MGKLLTSTWCALIVAVVLVVVKVSNPYFVDVAQLKTFDYLISKMQPKHSDEIVIVEFGEKSVEKFGQWPFDRRDIASVIKKLRENGAGVIVAPILFSEKDRAGGDDELSKTIIDNGVVIAQSTTSQTIKPDAVRRGFSNIGAVDPSNYVFTWSGGLAPIKPMADAAAGVGTIAVAPERDGVVRRLPLLVGIAGNFYPSLPLESIRVASGETSYQIKTSEAGVEAVRIPGIPPITTDEHGRIWLTWNTKFDKIDATEINYETVTEKTIILGNAIEGAGGIIGTPVGEKWAYELQAQALQTILDGTSIQRPAYQSTIELGLLLLTLALILIIVPRLSVLWTIPFFLVFVGSNIYLSLYMFNTHLQLWDTSYILFAGSFSIAHLIFNNFAREFRLKQQIKKQFGTYLSPAMVEKLQKKPDLLKLGGETRELSIMFTDVRGFTTISEHYGSDVQGLTKIMNRYMTAMTAKIIENNGTLDKYIGDAQMAFWNAPLDDKDHAIHAVKTAMEMLSDLQAFNNAIAAEGVPAFGMGLGINTGDVVVGNMGSSQRFDYTCLGDSVNLASRLEGQSKPYHVKLVIGPKTAEYVRNTYHTLELDTLAVKGKNEGVKIYTVIPNSHWRGFDSSCHKEFMNHYYNQKWDAAIGYAKQLKDAFRGEMSEYYDMMIERINEYKANPPGEKWDGVFRTNTK
jgi:adenylate cyclase